ncbi:uncharacterized protein LOC100213281 isoform X1 [Hydra vulgaris]|uniref:uncharacterized protein LOC100213281 isoform X1 n=1 Tax=Hydra vulgaris TaxID=6087 RepID=UPI000640E74C|nr:uncharacterized protein LOC100213281 isoform X1 [Hydra vulgaris]
MGCFSKLFSRNRCKVNHHSLTAAKFISNDDEEDLKTEDISGEDKRIVSQPIERPKENDLQSEVIKSGVVGSLVGSSEEKKFFSSMLDNNNSIDDNVYNNYDFPFTNLVFEGGGNKGMAYAGALQVLEQAGIAQKINRVAGASVGAIAASLFAVGFTSEELKQFMEQDLRKVLVDHKCGYCSLLPNLLSGFGWNPGHKLIKWFGEQLKERTGNADITFREVLQRFNRELCIVVTNLNQMSTEYFHPKTTPNTPIKMAVRMSMALPGVFQSVKYVNDENTDVYVDGGLLCNYPIHAFDGWWLSMDPHDSFFKRLQPLDNYAKLFSKNERFGSWNPRTIGIMLYSRSETELMKTKLAQRDGSQPPPPVNSKLYKKRKKILLNQKAASEEHLAVVNAIGRFMKELHRMNFDLDGIVSLRELKKVFEVSAIFTTEDQMLLFGNTDVNAAFSELDKDKDGEITFQELMAFVERKGVNIQTRFLGYTRKEIKTLGDFISTLQTALSINVKRNYVEDRDIERTIGIDTDYIEANDFSLEDHDKNFLLQSGEHAARAFLRYYCKRHPEFRKRESALLPKDFLNSQVKSNFLHPSSNLVH